MSNCGININGDGEFVGIWVDPSLVNVDGHAYIGLSLEDLVMLAHEATYNEVTRPKGDPIDDDIAALTAMVDSIGNADSKVSDARKGIEAHVKLRKLKQSNLTAEQTAAVDALTERVLVEVFGLREVTVDEAREMREAAHQERR